MLCLLFPRSLLVLALLFVPLERMFPRLPEQRIFRVGWDTDLAHVAISPLLVQVAVIVADLTP